MKPVGVLLNGAGAKDGSEIHEAVFTLLALEQVGLEYRCLSLAEPQHHVANHLTGTNEPPTVKRSMIEESARIARGKVHRLGEVSAEDLSALVIPGGFGTAFNLCDFALSGAKMSVHPQVAELVTSLYAAHKPLAAICIAPVILGRLLGENFVELTLGEDDSGPARVLSEWGAKHTVCQKGDCVVDAKHKILTTPAYMHADSTLDEVWRGIRKLAGKLAEMLAISVCVPE